MSGYCSGSVVLGDDDDVGIWVVVVAKSIAPIGIRMMISKRRKQINQTPKKAEKLLRRIRIMREN